jgi:hypothetical protein
MNNDVGSKLGDLTCVAPMEYLEVVLKTQTPAIKIIFLSAKHPYAPHLSDFSKRRGGRNDRKYVIMALQRCRQYRINSVIAYHDFSIFMIVKKQFGFNFKCFLVIDNTAYYFLDPTNKNTYFTMMLSERFDESPSHIGRSIVHPFHPRARSLPSQTRQG